MNEWITMCMKSATSSSLKLPMRTWKDQKSVIFPSGCPHGFHPFEVCICILISSFSVLSWLKNKHHQLLIFIRPYVLTRDILLAWLKKHHDPQISEHLIIQLRNTKYKLKVLGKTPACLLLVSHISGSNSCKQWNLISGGNFFKPTHS